MIQNDCFFFIDTSLEKDKQTIKSICLECHEKDFKNKNCWFWNGKKLGYGPWDIKCDQCNCFIHEISRSAVD